MFEARLKQGGVLKKLSVVLQDFAGSHRMSSFDCTANGLGLQALDTAHVTLVSVMLHSGGFNYYRCDRPISFGVNVDDLARALEGANDDDVVTMKADDQGNMATFMFESAKEARVSEFKLTLSALDSKRLAIPDHPYLASVRMPSKTFQRICRHLHSKGDFMHISCTEDTARFTTCDEPDADHITIWHAETDTVIDVQYPIWLFFEMDDFTSILKAAPLSPVVTLFLAEDMHMIVKYPMRGIGHISFHLDSRRMGDE